jgi:FdhE protein
MTQIGPANYDPIQIGEIAKPPFARLPDPPAMFARRAARLRVLAERHELHAYLKFLADLCEVQHRLQPRLPDAELPGADAIAQARQFGMPPLDRSLFTPDVGINAVLERILTAADDVAMPEAARLALERVRASNSVARAAMVDAVLSDTAPVEALAEHVFVAAALQVHFARLAAQLNAKALVPVGQGACPVCAAPPVSSMVVGWSGAQNTRFCACSLCGTLWNYPRIKCALCGSTASIAYQEIAGGSATTVKAETCDSCHSYVKILHQHTNPSLDPIADDVATLALDLLLRESGYRRGGVNPFLIGY